LSFIDGFKEGELTMDQLKEMATELVNELSKNWQDDVEAYVDRIEAEQ